MGWILAWFEISGLGRTGCSPVLSDKYDAMSRNDECAVCRVVGAGGSVSSTMAGGRRSELGQGERCGVVRGGVAYILTSTESTRKVVHLQRLEHLQKLDQD